MERGLQPNKKIPALNAPFLPPVQEVLFTRR